MRSFHYERYSKRGLGNCDLNPVGFSLAFFSTERRARFATRAPGADAWWSGSHYWVDLTEYLVAKNLLDDSIRDLSTPARSHV